MFIESCREKEHCGGPATTRLWSLAPRLKSVFSTRAEMQTLGRQLLRRGSFTLLKPILFLTLFLLPDSDTVLCHLLTVPLNSAEKRVWCNLALDTRYVFFHLACMECCIYLISIERTVE